MSAILINILIILAVMMAGFLALVRYLELSAYFSRAATWLWHPSMIGLPWEDVYFKTRDNVTLNGWFFKNPRAQSTIIICPWQCRQYERQVVQDQILL